MSFTPIRVDQFEKGVVENEEAFKIPDNAFVDMQNTYVFRNRVKTRPGNRFLGRLRRCVTINGSSQAGTTDTYEKNIITQISLESNADIERSSVTITIGGKITVEDQGDGTLTKTGGSATLDSANSFINYASGDVKIVLQAPGVFANETVEFDICYFPNLPVMGIHVRELEALNAEETLIFDTKYCYLYNTGAQKFEEFIQGFTWTGSDSNFFNGVNYSTDVNNNNLFWTTNFSGTSGDPIRYTEGSTWTDFAPEINSNGTTNLLNQCLLLVPFRGLFLAMNTYEGVDLGTSVNYQNRVRGSQIGDPLQADAWRDDIPGKGFFFDLPTNEAILAYGFVRDELVIFCERSSWLLSFTSNSSVPIVDQRENNDLGVESTYSVINFDDNVVGVGDKYIVTSNAVDTKAINDEIPDFAFDIHNANNGRRRVHGARDYNERLAYWTYPEFDTDDDNSTNALKFPNRILVWNYVQNAYSYFRDNITTFGVYQQFSDILWRDVTWTWAEWTTTWDDGLQQSQYPDVIGGNQHGYIMYMHRQLLDDASMPIQSITKTGDQLTLNIPDHNLENREFIYITNAQGTNVDNINNVIYQISVVDEDNILLYELSQDGTYIEPATRGSFTYRGGGEAALYRNFRLLSKKFNLIDQAKKVFLAYIDLMMNVDTDATFNLNLYKDYMRNSLDRSPFWSQDIKPIIDESDPPDQTKIFKKFFVGVISDMVQYELTISDLNMMNLTPGMAFQIDSIVLHIRPSGKLTV